MIWLLNMEGHVQFTFEAPKSDCSNWAPRKQ